MLNGKKILAAAAAMAAAPLASQAAIVVNYTYDAATIQISTVAAFTAGTVTTVPIVAGAVSVPSNDFFRFGVDVKVTGNTNAASGGAYDTANGTVQPALLGLNAFGLDVLDSNNALLTPQSTSGNSRATFPASMWGTTGKGAVNASTGTVGDGGAFLSGGNNAASAIDGSAPQANGSAIIGVPGPQLIFSNVIYKAGAGNGAVVLTPQQPAGSTALVVLDVAGNSTTPPTYKSSTTTGATLNNLPVLTVNVGTVTTGQNIISLTAAAPSTYGSNSGTLTVTGSNGSYLPAKIVGLSSGKAFVEGKGFNPASDTEIYGLDVVGAGSIAQLITDINTQAGSTIAFAAYPGPGTNPLGAEMNLFLKFTAGLGTGDNFLGFDLSQATTANNQSATISEVALVPEPASAAGLLIGASGLLMGRRKRKA